MRTDVTHPTDDVATHLVVRPWWDAELAVRGHDPRSPYAERFWLPLVGPSTLLLLRRFARGLDELPSGFQVSVGDTSRALGLGGGAGRRSTLQRTIDRAVSFGLARRGHDGVLEVRTHLPPLSARQVERLPSVLRRVHADLVRRAAADAAGDAATAAG